VSVDQRNKSRIKLTERRYQPIRGSQPRGTQGQRRGRRGHQLQEENKVRQRDRKVVKTRRMLAKTHLQHVERSYHDEGDDGYDQRGIEDRP